MELNLNRTFTEKIEDIILDNTLNNEFMKNHLLIFDIENNDRRNILLQIITKANWKRYDNDLHDFDDEFDYVYFYGSYFDKKGLYDTFQNFNGKTIIFDNETLLNKQPLIDILEGAICSSPDSGSKWPIRLDGQKEFKFTGSVILLTNQERDKFSKKKKYEYLTRDMMKI
jgi:hypothetical protein